MTSFEIASHLPITSESLQRHFRVTLRVGRSRADMLADRPGT